MLTQGQQYAVNFLKSKGFKFISSGRQIERGNLIFEEPNGEVKWAIFRSSGYVRKWKPGADRWSVIHRELPAQHEGGGDIEDDQYMDLAELISLKYSNEKKREQKEKTPEYIELKNERERKERINNVYHHVLKEILEGPGASRVYYPGVRNRNEQEEVVKKLMKYFKL